MRVAPESLRDDARWDDRRPEPGSPKPAEPLSCGNAALGSPAQASGVEDRVHSTRIAIGAPQAPRSSGTGFMLRHRPIGPLRRFWALGEERIILASALTAHLRKHIMHSAWAYLLAKQALYH